MTVFPFEWIRGAIRVWQRDYESWKDFATASLVGTVAEPIMFFLAMGFGLGRFVEPIGGQSYLAFLAPGLVAATAMNTAAFETTFGSFTRLTEQHTYEAIVKTPISVGEIVAGDIFWAASKSVLGAGVILAIMAALGLLTSSWALAALPLAFVIGVLFGALGMAWTALAPSYTFFNYFFTLVIGAQFLFGGVFFPLTGLPVWAVWTAWCLPLTHAVFLMRALVNEGPEPGLWVHAAVLGVITIAIFLVASRLIRRRLIR
ncbi:MAG TPA: ABC transporter permease [Gemmatimonadota bacterium]|nr:ABC transporter permease [Gemmatimonadota bacterium]